MFNRGKRSLTDVTGLTYSFRALSFNNDKFKRLVCALQFTNFSPKEVETPTSKLDKKLIYYGSLTSHVRNVRLLSIVSTAVTLSIQPLIYEKLCAMDNVIAVAFLSIFIGAFGYLSPIIMHIVMKKYVTHIYFNEISKTYTAETYSFFMRKTKTVFTQYDVTVPDISGMFSTCIIKGKPMYISLNSFDGPYHYKKIMGYDKPWDFKIHDDDVDNSSKNSATAGPRLK